MEKQIDSFAYTMAIFDVLVNRTDAEKILKAEDIIRILKDEYGITIGIKRFYKGIHILSQYFEISTYLDNRHGYYFIQGPLDPSEAIYLCHNARASKDLTPSQIESLEERLLAPLSDRRRQEYLDSVLLSPSDSPGSADWLYHIEILSEAAYRKKWICFHYETYDINKDRHKAHKRYVREPRYILFSHSRAYLITTDDHHDTPGHYRIDRMSDITILKDDVTTPFTREDAARYAAGSLFMFSGEPVEALFLCDAKKHVYGIMIDEFGKDVHFEPAYRDKRHFLMRVKASYDDLRIFAQKYGDIVCPLQPKQLVNDIKNFHERSIDRIAVYTNILAEGRLTMPKEPNYFPRP